MIDTPTVRRQLAAYLDDPAAADFEDVISPDKVIELLDQLDELERSRNKQLSRTVDLIDEKIRLQHRVTSARERLAAFEARVSAPDAAVIVEGTAQVERENAARRAADQPPTVTVHEIRAGFIGDRDPEVYGPVFDRWFREVGSPLWSGGAAVGFLNAQEPHHDQCLVRGSSELADHDDDVAWATLRGLLDEWSGAATDPGGRHLVDLLTKRLGIAQEDAA